MNWNIFKRKEQPIELTAIEPDEPRNQDVTIDVNIPMIEFYGYGTTSSTIDEPQNSRRKKPLTSQKQYNKNIKAMNRLIVIWALRYNIIVKNASGALVPASGPDNRIFQNLTEFNIATFTQPAGLDYYYGLIYGNADTNTIGRNLSQLYIALAASLPRDFVTDYVNQVYDVLLRLCETTDNIDALRLTHHQIPELWVLCAVQTCLLEYALPIDRRAASTYVVG